MKYDAKARQSYKQTSMAWCKGVRTTDDIIATVLWQSPDGVTSPSRLGGRDLAQRRSRTDTLYTAVHVV